MLFSIFISGGGTTMEEVLRQYKRGNLKGAWPVLIICSDPHAKGVQKALNSGVPVVVVILERKKFRTREEYGTAILRELRRHGVQWIFQCGWTEYTPDNVIAEFEGRIVNQHPGMLPWFGGEKMRGLRVHETTLIFAAEFSWLTTTEATVHFVWPGFDTGPVIAVTVISIQPGDTAETLAKRVLPFEHILVVATIRAAALGLLKPLERSVRVLTAHEQERLAQARLTGIARHPNG